MYIPVCMCAYIYISRERESVGKKERERETEREGARIYFKESAHAIGPGKSKISRAVQQAGNSDRFLL